VSGASPELVTISLYGDAEVLTTVTDVNGNFAFYDLAPGSYIVGPTRTGFVFTPVISSVAVSDVSSPYVRFDAAAAASVSVSVSGDEASGVPAGSYNWASDTSSSTGVAYCDGGYCSFHFSFDSATAENLGGALKIAGDPAVRTYGATDLITTFACWSGLPQGVWSVASPVTLTLTSVGPAVAAPPFTTYAIHGTIAVVCGASPYSGAQGTVSVTGSF
jgi:hypothetical protein